MDRRLTTVMRMRMIVMMMKTSVRKVVVALYITFGASGGSAPNNRDDVVEE